MINCDDVFEVLTRGPFPTGKVDDIAVEIHLCQCASCRRLAEALRPAIELFEEAVADEEKQDLPGYWGVDWAEDDCEDNIATREMPASPVSRERRPYKSPHAAALAPSEPPIGTANIMPAVGPGMSRWESFTSNLAARNITVAAIVLCFAGIAMAMIARDRADTRQIASAVMSGSGSNGGATWNTLPGGAPSNPEWRLTTIAFVRACEESRQPRSEGENGSTFACCSGCHSQGIGLPPAAAAATNLVARTCATCHQ